MQNTTTPLGGISIIDKVENDFGAISSVFGGVLTPAYIGRMKILLNNRLTYATSIHQILPTISEETCTLLGAEDASERSLYRTVEKMGALAPLIVERYQDFVKRNNFVDKDQNIDWSSTFFEGKKAEIGAFGYSRDHRPDKRQVTFGIATGINGVPTALTIQNGNVLDKKHFAETYNVVKRILQEGSLLIFDCGANTIANKAQIVKDRFEYLTLKPKKVGVYRKYIAMFKSAEKSEISICGNTYVAAKVKENDEFQYIYFSKTLLETQILAKNRKFERQKETGNKLAKKAGKHEVVEKYPCEKGWVELYPELQTVLGCMENPYINGVEGFFILESTVNASPEEMLKIYKQRDAAEKLVRNMKEGIELRPIRHWSKYAIIGAILIAFLTESLISLTQISCKNPLVKNVKLLKKFLTNLTATFVYPSGRFRFIIVSNISPPISELFGDFVHRYETKDLNLRW
jgi:transposase